MSYTAKDLFPEWYSTVEPQPTADAIAARTKAIKKIATKEKKSEVWFDIVRLFLGIKVKAESNRESFVQEFKSADDNFPLINNDNLVRVLASATLCFKLETDDSKLNNIVSLAIRNSIFFDQFEISNKIPVVPNADAFLSSNRYADRRMLLSKAQELTEAYAKPPGSEAKSEDDRDKLANGIVLPIISAYKSLSEETNILWWLFSEYSDLNRDYFGNLNHLNLVVTGAFELSKLTEFSRGLISAEPILQKALAISNGGKSDFKKTNVYEVTNSLKEEIKNKLELPTGGVLNEFTPCLKAIEISLGHNTDDNWTGAFSKQTNGADAKKKFEPVELASQFYRELTFLKCL